MEYKKKYTKTEITGKRTRSPWNNGSKESEKSPWIRKSVSS